MEQLFDDLGRDTFVGLELHTSGPLSNTWTNQRSSYYGITGTPTIIFDGISKVIGGGSGLYDTYLSRIESRLFYKSHVDFEMDGLLTEDSGEITLTVTVLDYLAWNNMKVRFYVYEDDCYSGGKYYHYVVRKSLTQENLTIKNVGEQQVITRSFTMDPAWDPEKVGVVAFIQEDSWKEVLQSGELSKVTFTAEGLPDAYLATDYDFDLHIENITEFVQSADFWVDLYLPNGDPYAGNPFIGPESAALPGLLSTTVPQTISIPGSAPLGTYGIRTCVGNYPDDVWFYEVMEVDLNACR